LPLEDDDRLQAGQYAGEGIKADMEVLGAFRAAEQESGNAEMGVADNSKI